MASSFTVARFIELVSLLGNELAPSKARNQYRLSSHELSCLRIIEQFGPLPMSQVSDFLDISKPRATQLVNKLEDYNFVRRMAARDKRSITVKILPRGARLLSEFRKYYLGLSKNITAQLTAEEQKIFEELCEKIQLTYKKNPTKV